MRYNSKIDNLSVTVKPPFSTLSLLCAEEAARKLEIRQVGFQKWARRGVPIYKVLQVEEKLGVPREVLRPDLFAPSECSGEQLEESSYG
jgi:hypothetical protein